MTYEQANVTAQWFYTRFRNARFANGIEKVVWHTTEGTGWPGYDDGAKAPHYTVKPNFTLRRMEWRAHFPDNVFSRALRNEAGGVQTNTDGALQVEIVGTCDPGVKWKGSFLKSWELEDWMIRDLAKFALWCSEEHKVPLASGLRFKKYDDSYGKSNGVRMGGQTWNAFRGHCGHQHVPENDHGDPGAFPIMKILEAAQDLRNTSKPTPQKEEEDDMKLTDKVELSAAAVRNLNAAGNTFKVGDEVSVEYLLLWGDARSQMAFREIEALDQKVTKLQDTLNQILAKVSGPVVTE